MIYHNMMKGIFLRRPNRFIAQILIDGVEETVHVKNTGRCRELLLPGAEVMVQMSDNPNRKTKYDLIAVYKNALGWVNIDSQVTNVVAGEWLRLQPDITYIKPEYTYGDSRVDFYFEKSKTKCLMEVKGCTLEIDGVGYFPDAPTERGIKHLHELMKAAQAGHECYLAFVIAMPGISHVEPNMATHPQFGEALDEARQAGVMVLDLMCDVGPDRIEVKGWSYSKKSNGIK